MMEFYRTLNLSLDIVNSVGRFHLKGDGLPREGFHKDLHDGLDEQKVSGLHRNHVEIQSKLVRRLQHIENTHLDKIVSSSTVNAELPKFEHTDPKCSTNPKRICAISLRYKLAITRLMAES